MSILFTIICLIFRKVWNYEFREHCSRDIRFPGYAYDKDIADTLVNKVWQCLHFRVPVVSYVIVYCSLIRQFQQLTLFIPVFNNIDPRVDG